MAGVKQKTITCNISFLRHLMEGGCDCNRPKVIYENIHDPWLNSIFFFYFFFFRKNIILQFSIERYEL